MSLSRQFGKPVTGGNVTSAKQENKPTAKPVTMVTVTRAEHDKLKAEVEKLRAEIIELREIVAEMPFTAPAARAERQPSKRDRAGYMREYRKRRKATP